MNIILIAVLAIGLYSASQLRRETFPEFDLEVIMITVPFPGATPEEVALFTVFWGALSNASKKHCNIS
jgi:multidrug efflux pump subunit AcrB